MIPRIFGPYESLQGSATTRPTSTSPTPAAHNFSQSVYVQANWPLERSLDEVLWVHEQHEGDRLAGRDRRLRGPVRARRLGATLEAQSKATPLMRGCRLQVHWHENPQGYRFGAVRRSRCSTRRSAGTSELVAGARIGRSKACRCSRTSSSRTNKELHRRAPRPRLRAHPRRDADRGRAVARDALRAARDLPPNLCVKLSGQGTFIRRVDSGVAEDRDSRRSLEHLRLRAARCSAPTSRWKASGRTSLAWSMRGSACSPSSRSRRSVRHPRPDRATRYRLTEEDSGMTTTSPAHRRRCRREWLREGKLCGPGRTAGRGRGLRAAGRRRVDVRQRRRRHRGVDHGRVRRGGGRRGGDGDALLRGPRQPRLETYGISDELAGTVGLMCGGIVHIFIHELLSRGCIEAVLASTCKSTIDHTSRRAGHPDRRAARRRQALRRRRTG